MNLGKETETLEFKKSASEAKDAMVSIAAMLNKHGLGTLYFGVKPNGDTVGQEVSESSLRDISRIVYEAIRPQIYPVIEEVKIESSGKSLIKVEFSGENAPYSAYGRYYLRTADEDREASPESLKEFFAARKRRLPWEDALSTTPIEEIDPKSVAYFIENAKKKGRLPEGDYGPEEILNRFGLSKDGYLTKAGRLLFGNDRPLPVKWGIFATEEKLTILDMAMFEDNIFNLLETLTVHIMKNIRWSVEIESGSRIETPEIPRPVVREALANAFAHASYDSRTYHEVCLFPGSLTIYSPGEYASEYSPEEYINLNVQSEIRNPVIAKMLYLSGDIEQFGSGFRRIHSLSLDAGITYSYEKGRQGFKFIINRPTRPADNLVSGLNATEMAVLALLKQNPRYLREELAIKVSKTERTIQRTLNSLKEKGYIKRAGGKKDPTWVVLK